MDLTQTAFGMWSAGRFMHFGEALEDPAFTQAVQYAYEQGIRTFVTADVYGLGESDSLLAQSLGGFPRDSYCLVGAVGHDFYEGQREGSKGFPRFTDPTLRGPDAYADYLRMVTEKSLARSRTDHFDLLLLHNPDQIGYTSEAVWEGMAALKSAGLATQLGIAPGPANGFALDVIQCLERFADHIDWAMIILNPLEPWPGHLCLPAAEKTKTKILTRVADYGGLFHDDVKPNHQFAPRDHRTYRPAGWVEAGCERMEKLRPIAEAHDLTMLQFACAWNLQHAPVASVVPTLIQEPGPTAKPLRTKIEELAQLSTVTFTDEELATIRAIGDNTNRMVLKGGNPEHTEAPLPDRWSLNADLAAVADRWDIDPARDLVKI